MPHFFRVVDPSRRVVGVEKLPISLATVRGIIRKSFFNQCSMPFSLLKVFSKSQFIASENVTILSLDRLENVAKPAASCLIVWCSGKIIF